MPMLQESAALGRRSVSLPQPTPSIHIYKTILCCHTCFTNKATAEAAASIQHCNCYAAAAAAVVAAATISSGTAADAHNITATQKKEKESASNDF
eukprot:scaffold294_cov80-Skeletonema_marinoi.AAC.1